MSIFSAAEINRWLDQIDSGKPRIRVGIYGAYFPETDHQILIKLRDRLKAEGFAATYLVEDIEDPGRFSGDRFIKSKFSLEKSSVNLFVATFSGVAQGYATELQHVLLEPEIIFKSAILPETDYDENGNEIHSAMTSLLEQDIAGINFKVSKWKKGDFEDLVGVAKSVIEGLYYYYVKHRRNELD